MAQLGPILAFFLLLMNNGCGIIYTECRDAYVPGSDMTNLNKIEASKILDLVDNNQDVSLENNIILGDIALTSREINCTINIKNSEIIGNLLMGNVTIKKPISFEDTSFSGIVNLASTHFEGPVTFSGARFKKYLALKGANFIGDAYFIKCKYDEDVNGDGSVYCRGAYFDGAQFRGDAYFQKSQFIGMASFEDTIFLKDAHFSGTVFQKKTTFKESQFDRITDFSKTKFYGNAILSSSCLCGPCDFSNSLFDRNSYFDRTQIDRSIKFANSTFRGIASFYAATFESKAKFERAQFYSSINLTEATLSNFLLPWDSIKGRVINDDESVYFALIENYKRLGWIVDATGCYYEYKEIQKDRAEDWKTRAIYSLSWVVCGYGVRPDFTMILSISLVIIFALIYYTGKGIKVLKSKDIQTHSQKSVDISTADKIVDVDITHENIAKINIMDGGSLQAYIEKSSSEYTPSIFDALIFSTCIFIFRKNKNIMPCGAYIYIARVESLLGLFLYGLLSYFLMTFIKSYFHSSF